MYSQERVEDIRSYDLFLRSLLSGTARTLGSGVDMSDWKRSGLTMIHDPETNRITYHKEEVEKIEEP